MLDRSLARGLGTIVGTLLLSAILFFQPHLIVAVILMGLSAMMTEGFVAEIMRLQLFLLQRKSSC